MSEAKNWLDQDSDRWPTIEDDYVGQQITPCCPDPQDRTQSACGVWLTDEE